MTELSTGTGITIVGLFFAAVPIVIKMMSVKANRTQPENPINAGLANSIIKILEILEDFRTNIAPHLIVMKSKIEGTHELLKETNYIAKRNGDKIEGIEEKVESIDKATGLIRETQQSIERRIK